jgi:hypothetical protein
LYFLFVDLRSGIHISPIWFAIFDIMIIQHCS